ncbi:hypothetical protein NB705_003618 [Xanthomonas sacchari]|nr:hypothetical protein [Xanthomonas sacchari]MCW0450353.1 hypothetical protein [Xanthomonas sacchari]MCW0466545.1 hypothetical protein [Xanthomonas sacchari]
MPPSPPTRSMSALRRALAMTSAFSLDTSLPASIDASACLRLLSSSIRNSSWPRALSLSAPIASNLRVRPSASANRRFSTTTASAMPIDSAALALALPICSSPCALACSVSASTRASLLPCLRLASALASITRASAIPTFSIASAEASLTCASARPGAAFSARMPSASSFLASACLPAASCSACARVVSSTARCLAAVSRACASLTWRTSSSCALASASRIVTCLSRSASATWRTSLIRSSSCATVLSMAMRSRVMLATSILPFSTTLSRSTPCSCTSRSVVTCSSWRARATRSTSMATARWRFCSATSTSRRRFCSRMSISCCASMRAFSANWRCSSCTFSVSACSRARIVSTSRFCRASASACCRSSASIASRASTFFLVIASFAFCSSSLVTTFWVPVSSVILRMPSASRMLCGSSSALGVCSR